jgi:hypothetical protein
MEQLVDAGVDSIEHEEVGDGDVWDTQVGPEDVERLGLRLVEMCVAVHPKRMSEDHCRLAIVSDDCVEVAGDFDVAWHRGAVSTHEYVSELRRP